MLIADGEQSGHLTKIDDTGAPSIYFHDFPHVMQHDAYSGDYGSGSGSASRRVPPSWSTRARPALFSATGKRRRRTTTPSRCATRTASASTSSRSASTSSRRRHLCRRRSDLGARTVRVDFAAAAASAAGALTYDSLRLRVDKVALADAKRLAATSARRAGDGRREAEGCLRDPGDRGGVGGDTCVRCMNLRTLPTNPTAPRSARRRPFVRPR